MIGAGGDQFLKLMPGLTAFYMVWETEPEYIKPQGASFKAEGIDYLFNSKSGGEILNTVLFARHLAVQAYQGLKEHQQETVIVLPRMYSVMVVTASKQIFSEKIFPTLKERYPMLTLHEGSRSF
jgi:hypothetical protein